MNNEEKPLILLFSDGGADPNPGVGGFGVILKYGKHVKEFSVGYKLTTNNRMELMGVIYGLKQLNKNAIVHVCSDSKYVVNAINKGWLDKWKENNWLKNKKEKALNIDLWKRLLDLIEIHDVKFEWVKGHAGHPENERCDHLATIAMQGDNLIEDTEYLHQKDNPVDGKVNKEGDLCRKCDTPVVLRENKLKKLKAKQKFYYKYYMVCTNCSTIYMTEEAKVEIKRDSNTLFD